MLKNLHFTQSRSGNIFFVDRAGNTGSVFLDLEIEATADFTVSTKPAFRQYAQGYHGLSGLAATGDFWLAYKDQSNNWIFTHKSTSGDAQLRTNANGTGVINVVVPASGTEFLVAFKGEGMLSIGFTGIWTNDIFDTGTNYFDFTSGTNNSWSTVSALFPEFNYNDETYIKVGDVSFDTVDEYDLINDIDFNAINLDLTVGVSYSSPFYYDFDINNVINAIEQAIIIAFDENY